MLDEGGFFVIKFENLRWQRLNALSNTADGTFSTTPSVTTFVEFKYRKSFSLRQRTKRRRCYKKVYNNLCLCSRRERTIGFWFIRSTATYNTTMICHSASTCERTVTIYYLHSVNKISAMESLCAPLFLYSGRSRFAARKMIRPI